MRLEYERIKEALFRQRNHIQTMWKQAWDGRNQGTVQKVIIDKIGSELLKVSQIYRKKWSRGRSSYKKKLTKYKTRWTHCLWVRFWWIWTWKGKRQKTSMKFFQSTFTKSKSPKRKKRSNPSNKSNHNNKISVTAQSTTISWPIKESKAFPTKKTIFSAF